MLVTLNPHLRQPIFVYGSLKRGQENHGFLKGLKRYKARAPQIDLHAGPRYTLAVRGRSHASGEVYFIHRALLKKLDRLEGHPHDYHRELTTVILAHGQITQAWIYLRPQQAYRYPLLVNKPGKFGKR